MKASLTSKFLALTLATGIVASPIKAAASDIDIFTANSGGTAAAPNILIVLDNTSNWARASQKWPGGIQQGQAEVRAIKTVVNELPEGSVNIGLMEYATTGSANDNGGFIRHAIKNLTNANRTALSAKMDTIFSNINSPDEKRNSNTEYGNLVYDIYNYLSGGNSYSPDGVLASIADSSGYDTTYTKFKSPLSAGGSCANTYVIFISNPNANGPASDSSANTTTLSSLGGNTTQLGLPNLTTTSTQNLTYLGNTASCYSSASTCSTTGFESSCSSYTDGCACGDAVSTSTSSCASDSLTYTIQKSVVTYSTSISTGTATTSEAWSNSCYSNLSNAKSGIESGSDHGSLTCPASSTSGSTSTTYSCSYSVNTGSGTTDSTGCSSGNKKYKFTQTATPTNTTTTASAPALSSLGTTSSCYASADACTSAISGTSYASSCTGTGVSCSCTTPTSATTGSSCAAGTSKYKVNGVDTISTLTSTGTTSTDTGPRNADEWSRFLHDKGVPVPSTSDKRFVSTYTVDVYNAQPNATHTALMWNMAKYGGGQYFAATNEDAIVDALKQIINKILAENSSFASTSLPVNATNRSQNLNQVFIGMFRPDIDANPRWFGNLKRYKLINSSGSIELGDSNGSLAVNNTTGFIDQCAKSYWTNDASNYWNGVTTSSTGKLLDPIPLSTCSTLTTDAQKYSDSPDGPFVEKGGVGQIIRQGNNPTATSTSPTWTVNRTIYTLSSGALASFSTTTSGLDEDLVKFIRGEDVNGEKYTAPSTYTRPSIHGDVVHSRPLPVNYGSTDPSVQNVTVYYGANDGMFRAVNADNGKERWAFMADEFFSRLARQKTNSPLVNYPGVIATPSPTEKDYFFDGTTGIYQTFKTDGTADKVWIYPSMRRGGRRIYALDVSNSSSPSFKWRAGCPNLTDDSSCAAGAGSGDMTGIGQTWSFPNVAFVKGYGTATDGTGGDKPVIILGGGYDSCEDDNSSAPACTSAKGNKVYVLDANDGSLLASFTTEGRVAGDVSLVDVNNDGKVDYAYATTTTGNIYRIDFVDTSRNALAKSAWASYKVAYTTGSGRKFLFGPAILPTTNNKVYLAIGSGDREHPLQTHYPYTTPITNRFYVYLDDTTKLYPGTGLTANVATNLDGSDMANFSSSTTCSTTGVTPTSAYKGWYMNLSQGYYKGTTTAIKGEQVVTSALIVGGMATFSTNFPVPDTNSCSTSLGEARGYWVNLLNGSGAVGVDGICGGDQYTTFVAGGLPPSPVVAQVPVVDATGKEQIITTVIGAAQKDGGASTIVSPQKVRPSITSKRKKTYSYISK